VPEGFVPPKIFVTEKINTDPVVDSNLIKILNKISTPQNAESVYTPEEVLLLQKYKNNKLNKIADSTSRKIDLVLKLKSRPELILPMYRIVSNKDGLVQVNLNDFLEKKYSIRFYEEDSNFLFELKNIKVASFLLDKSNFHHAGWFKSELYDNGKLIETNRFFIPKDF
jgi:hypothetical protein